MDHIIQCPKCGREVQKLDEILLEREPNAYEFVCAWCGPVVDYPVSAEAILNKGLLGRLYRWRKRRKRTEEDNG